MSVRDEQIKDFYFFNRLVVSVFEVNCMVYRELNSTEELANWLESAYSYLAMVDYPYPSAFMMPLPGHPIREVTVKFVYFLNYIMPFTCIHTV